MRSLVDDLQAAWRSLRHAPGFALAAIVTIALAVGANTAVMSIADAVLFRPLPYDDPDRVFVLQALNRRTGQLSNSIVPEVLQAIDDHHQGLSTVGQLEDRRGIVVPDQDGAQTVAVAAVTANYLSVLGVRPARGRVFNEQDLESGAAAMLSYASWQQRFAGREDIVGQSVTLGTSTFDIVGVLPAGFAFPAIGSAGASRPELMLVMPRPTRNTFLPVVRLEPGISRERAQAEIDALVMPLMAETARDPRTLSLEDVRGVLYPTGRPIMQLLLVAALLVLIVGCANLATMVLARTRRHEREIGIRVAIGASTMRLIMPVMLEGLMIGASGAWLAIVMAALWFDAMLPHVPPVAYGAAAVGIDARVIATALVLGLAAGALFAIVPAWRLAQADVRVLMQRVTAVGGSRQPFGRTLIALQVAVALVLVFGTVIAGRAFVSVLQVELGFASENVATVVVSLPPDFKGAQRFNFFRAAVDALAGQPDVMFAGAATLLPLEGAMPDTLVQDEGGKPIAGVTSVLPGFFESVGLRLGRGRLPTHADLQAGAMVAVVTVPAARAIFGDRDPLGASFIDGAKRRFTVVGVIGDPVQSLGRASLPIVYALPQDDLGRMTLVARTTARSESALANVKRTVSALAPTAPVVAVWWGDTIDGLTVYRNPRFQTIVLGAFAALALGLTALGVFSVVAFVVASRTREMGVRLALGGTPGSLVRLVLKQTTIPVLAGIVLGLLATRGLAQLAEAQLYQVRTQDPATLAAAAVIVLVAALAAAYLPARRAARVDPVITLRAEA